MSEDDKAASQEDQQAPKRVNREPLPPAIEQLLDLWTQIAIRVAQKQQKQQSQEGNPEAQKDDIEEGDLPQEP